ncbi:MAG TPA: type II toxin-antitoxin system VapC family toxin [Myxococcota bacterium]|nr:type II toxin-antitoxin system VapC family toxin [Myxococcota bacterium]
MTRTEVLVDANVFMYALGGPHTYRDPCRAIVRSMGSSERGWVPVVDAELFQEIAYRYRRSGRPELGLDIQRGILALGLRVVAIDERVLAEFISLQLGHPQASARDLVHVAVMQSEAIDSILTADRSFESLGVTRLDPLDFASGL